MSFDGEICIHMIVQALECGLTTGEKWQFAALLEDLLHRQYLNSAGGGGRGRGRGRGGGGRGKLVVTAAITPLVEAITQAIDEMVRASRLA